MKKGQLSIQILIYGAVAIIMLGGFLIWTQSVITASNRQYNRYLALNISEAGIEYYRWHLAHAPQDFQDGTGHAGPYTHDFFDRNGNKVGQFILDITAPLTGSTVVDIKSTGKIDWDQTIEKKIEAKLAIPSFAKYAVVLNSEVRIGEGSEIFGPIHSNGGVRVDGTAHNLVTSAVSSYDDPDHSGGNEFGVHTHRNKNGQTGTDNSFRPKEAPPNPVEDRSDVFLAGRQFPVPAVDFTGITQVLSQLKATASSSGFYRGPSGSGKYGYDIVLKTNGTFDLYVISALKPPPNNKCTNYISQDGWGTWSIQTETLLGNYSIPANGVIFIEDDAWVRGQINGSRVTIGSARFPDNSSTRSSITVNENLLYTNYDGRDAIGLIAQKNLNVGFYSADTIRIDAALVAQNGRVGRYYYRSPDSRCTTYHTRSAITSYGMIASSQRYGFAYDDGTGYQIRNLIYDSNLLYSPPPSFPLTSDSYSVIYWNEIK